MRSVIPRGCEHRRFPFGAMLLAILSLVAAACGDGVSATTTSQAPTTSEAGVTLLSVKADEVESGGAAVTAVVASSDDVVIDKVAVFFVGAKDNRSFGNGISVGAERAKAKLEQFGVQVEIVDNMNAPQDYERQSTAFIDEGFKYLLFAHGGVPDEVVKLASANPDVWICEVAAVIENLPPNACTVNLNFQNGDFLGGVLAGMLTKTNHIGAIIGPPFPILTSEMEGWVLGARWINPDVEVTQSVIETYTDVAPARTAGAALVGAGADVLFSATDQATQGLFEAAREKEGTFVFPQYFDSYDLAPDVVVTTVLFNLDGVAEQMINLGVLGQLESRDYTFGFTDDVGRLAPLREHADLFTSAQLEILNKVHNMISSGELVVPFLGEIGDAKNYDLSQLPAPPS